MIDRVQRVRAAAAGYFAKQGAADPLADARETDLTPTLVQIQGEQVAATVTVRGLPVRVRGRVDWTEDMGGQRVRECRVMETHPPVLWAITPQEKLALGDALFEEWAR